MRMDIAEVVGGIAAEGRALAFDHGSGVLTIPNTATAATAVIPHKLGKIPRRVLITSRSQPFGSYVGSFYTAYALTATDFTVAGFNLNGYSSGIASVFDWLVIA